MEPKLYIGNLSYNAKDEDLKELFSKYGSVSNVSIITDRVTGQSRGFGFVEMSSPAEAEKALELNGSDLLGRNITVAEAKPMEKKRQGPRRDRFSDNRFASNSPRSFR